MSDTFQAFLKDWTAERTIMNRKMSDIVINRSAQFGFPQVAALAVQMEQWIESYGKHWETIFPLNEVEAEVGNLGWYCSYTVEQDRVFFTFGIDYCGAEVSCKSKSEPMWVIRPVDYASIPSELNGDVDFEEDTNTLGLRGSPLVRLFRDLPMVFLAAYRDSMLDCYFGAEFYAFVCTKPLLIRLLGDGPFAGDTPHSIATKVCELHDQYCAILGRMVAAQGLR